jgi:menaquinone-9 beta-reductase
VKSVDVLVVGAGTAGAAAARACARAGLSVWCVDAQPLDQAGARWVNGMPLWTFDEAGVPRPTAPELRCRGNTFHMLAGWGPERAEVDTQGFGEVDMRLLVARLQADAVAAGATLEGERRVLGWRPDGTAAVVELDGAERDGVELDGQSGRATESVRANVVVDASGLNGAALVPRSPVPPRDICVAAQGMYGVTDLQAAQRWFRDHGAPHDETLVFTSIAGGFSVVNVRLEADHEPPMVAILAGSIPSLGHPSGTQVLAEFIREQSCIGGQSWVGEREFGGARAIPLAPPAPSLAHGPIVLLGDAGRQVYAAHGSGISAQLIAAGMLAKMLSEGRTPWEWNVAWQRRWGSELAAAGVFARFSSDLDVEQMRRLMVSGVMAPSLSRSSLMQKQPVPKLRDLRGMLKGVANEPALLALLAPLLAKMARVQLHWKRYPSSTRRLERWTRKRDRMLGR